MRRCGINKTSAFWQLAAEKDWLCRQTGKSDPQRVEVVNRIENVLAHPEVLDVLRFLEDQNTSRARLDPRADNPFLLAPCLFHSISTVQARLDTLKRLPVLANSSAEVRAHFQNASAKARGLARLLRKGAQPLIRLGSLDEHIREAFMLAWPCPIVQSPEQSEANVPLDWVLDSAAASLDSMILKIQGQHRRQTANTRTAKQLERRYAASVLVAAFRKHLKDPCHSRVASIVSALTGIATEPDYVKKIEKRKSAPARGQSP